MRADHHGKMRYLDGIIFRNGNWLSQDESDSSHPKTSYNQTSVLRNRDRIFEKNPQQNVPLV